MTFIATISTIGEIETNCKQKYDRWKSDTLTDTCLRINTSKPSNEFILIPVDTVMGDIEELRNKLLAFEGKTVVFETNYNFQPDNLSIFTGTFITITITPIKDKNKDYDSAVSYNTAKEGSIAIKGFPIFPYDTLEPRSLITHLYTQTVCEEGDILRFIPEETKAVLVNVTTGERIAEMKRKYWSSRRVQTLLNFEYVSPCKTKLTIHLTTAYLTPKDTNKKERQFTGLDIMEMVSKDGIVHICRDMVHYIG